MEPSIASLMSGFPPHPDNQVKASNWRTPRLARWSFNHLRQLLPTAPIAPASVPAALAKAWQDLRWLEFTDQQNQQHSLDQFLRASHTDAFAVMHKGRIVFDWYDGFGAADQPHIVFSITKSMAALVAGVLIGKGKLNPDCLVTDYLPELCGSAYDDARLQHLLDMQIASGFSENYLDSDGIFMAYRRSAAWNPVEEGVETDGLRAFLTKMPKSTNTAHGTMHHYCSPHSDVLGWVIERGGHDSFANQFSRYILQPCGGRHAAYITLDTFGAPRVAGGLCITAHDLLSIGEMVRNAGQLNGTEIVPSAFINDITKPRDNSLWMAQNHGEGPRLFSEGNYRSQWYQTGNSDKVICGIGIHGQWLWINPEKDLVIVKLASNDIEVDSATDRMTLAAFAAIGEALS